MADHGLTGTHHLDGSICTRTPSCPWSAQKYMAGLQGKTTLPVGPASFGGDVTKVFEAIANLDPQIHAQVMPHPSGMQSPATVMPKKPVTPPPLGPVVVMPPMPHTPTKGVRMSDNPIVPADLRASLPNRPDLTEEQRVLLEGLPDEGIQQVLDEALLDHNQQWSTIRRDVLNRATDALVKSLPNPNEAPVGTQDECLNCGLPITAQDNPPRWSDDIMGTTTCDRRMNLTGHSPKDVMAKHKAAMKKAAEAKNGTPGGHWIACAMGETASELLNSIAYLGPFSTEGERNKALSAILSAVQTAGEGDRYEFWPTSEPLAVTPKALAGLGSHGLASVTEAVWGI